MKPVSLTVNGAAVTAHIEPRTSLADFLREHLNLTGTHLGCEHGVCGACTLLVDGLPVRSCITLAAACEGAAVTTIEGLDDDEIAKELREAFSREHALQCGYCTPGMLISARDVVQRMPDAGERDIRTAMSGNLCRCTGYAGIVNAIRSVVSARKDRGASHDGGRALGPAGSGHGFSAAPGRAAAVRGGGPAAREATATGLKIGDPSDTAVGMPLTTLRQTFTVDHPRERVWAFFGRLGEVTVCLPGATLLGEPADDRVEARIRVKAGPIAATFDGSAHVRRDPATYTGTIRGAAHDAKSRSTARGEIRYELHEDRNAAATRIEIEMGFALTGPLAQFSRSSLIHDIARRMTESFAANLRARLGGATDASAVTDRGSSEINAVSLMSGVIWGRIKAALRKLVRR
jgi:carbon-monoxide dehydrogenase small subunit